MNLTASGTNGTSQVRVCIRDNGGTALGGVDSACFNFNIVANITSGKKAISGAMVNIFPNPSQNGIINWTSSQPITQIEVLDAAGRLVAKSLKNGASGSLSLQNKGLYMVKISLENGQVETRKVELR